MVGRLAAIFGNWLLAVAVCEWVSGWRDALWLEWSWKTAGWSFARLGDVVGRFRAGLLSGFWRAWGVGSRVSEYRSGTGCDGRRLIDRFEDDCLVAVGSDG
ncbi:MAG: hypothetical protein Ct9H300mP1_24820 [Planctomycetaceae bacterium]|nr:MAG: hypothetical protein Ct9H300mP1_24820 [Planctomycetaceae bacterium]